MKNQLLLDFQKYLHSKSLVQKKHIPYYANWASEFMQFSHENENLSHGVKLTEFLDHLKSRERISDWQIRQAMISALRY